MYYKVLWKDTSIFSQKETDKIPWRFETSIGVVDIKVHRIGKYKDWYITCRYLNIAAQKLFTPNDTLEEAKTEALRITHATLRQQWLAEGNTLDILLYVLATKE